GVCRRRDASKAAGEGSAAAGAGVEVRSADRGCAGQGASERSRAPRFEAGKRHADRQWGEVAGFWIGEGGAAAAERNDDDCGDDADDASNAGRDDCRNVSIHVAGAGGRKRGGRAERYFFARSTAVRDGDGKEGV